MRHLDWRSLYKM